MKAKLRNVCFGIMGLLAVSTATAQNKYAQAADSIDKYIYTQFYDQPTGLFTETNRRDKDEKPFSYMWPICALIQAANEMEVLQPGKAYMQPVMKAVEQYRSTKPPLPGYDAYPVSKGGDSRFYDDNQWVGLATIDAYQRTGNKEYLNVATEIYRFMMSGFDTLTGGGLYWKEDEKTSKNTCSNGPGIILALRLYQATGNKAMMDTALQLYSWMNRWLRSPEGLYYDAIHFPGNKINQTFYTYNSGTMLQSNALLYELTKKPEYLKEAQTLAAASLKRFYKNGKFPDNTWFNAVLMRGYEHVYKFDKNPVYLNAMFNYAEQEWKNGKYHSTGADKREKLLDVAGFYEIIARMANLTNTGFSYRP
jgi:predicted alpha-1,6-mannanase (GH76 family)